MKLFRSDENFSEENMHLFIREYLQADNPDADPGSLDDGRCWPYLKGYNGETETNRPYDRLACWPWVELRFALVCE